MIISTRTFRGAKCQRFRYAPSGNHYYMTQTKSGKTAVYLRTGIKVTKPGCGVEQWRKLDAEESREAIADLTAMYDRQPSFMQFFEVRS